MLNRQKSLLCLLHYAGGEASRLCLVKWCFLLAIEIKAGVVSAYYDFLPYRYGPYSFMLKHEIDRMVRDGLINKVDEKHWSLAETGKLIIRSTPAPIRQESKRLIWRYGKLNERELLDTVYNKYLWYTVNSEINGGRRQQRPIADNAVYTVGYERQSVDGFLNILLRSGIQTLLDVRHNPIARRFGFHKSTLIRLCENIGIDYQHIPALGIPSSLRRELRTRSDYLALLDRYNREILPGAHDALNSICEAVKDRPTALMCMEADAGLCHRSRVAAVVSEMTSLPVVHIKKGVDGCF